MSIHNSFDDITSLEKPKLNINPNFKLSQYFALTECQSPKVDPPHLISQYQASNVSHSEFESPSDDKICSELGSLIMSDSPKDSSPPLPDLSTSPTESVFSTGISHSLPQSLPNHRYRAVTMQSSGYSTFSEPDTNLRRVKTVASAYPHLKSRSRRNPSSTHKPVSAKSYNSMPSSDAVSYLSSFAESSAADINRVAPDEEGEEVGDYIMGKVIGHGAFSTVREAFTVDHNDGSLVKLAVKVIRKDDNLDLQHLEERILALQDEVAVWKQLRHPSLLKFVELIDSDYAEFVFMELCSHGTLLKLVMDKGKMPESEARMFFKQIAEAVRYLHQDAHITHCDLKLENLVLASKESVRLSDFGLSQQLHRTSTQLAPSGSIAYCPPELLASPPCSNSVYSDIWSLGIILFAMVAGKFPFSDGYEPRLVMKIRSGRFVLPDEFSPELAELMTKMLQPKPESRPSISDVLSSNWLQEP